MRARRTSLFSLLLASLLLVVMAGSTLAVPAPTGDRLNLLFETPATFDADTPFHVRHGICWQEPVETRIIRTNATGFELSVDGRRIGMSTEVRFESPCGYTEKWNQANFRAGLPAGPHTFTATWIVDGEVLFSDDVVVEFVTP